MINECDFFKIHINALLRKAINKAITRPDHAHTDSDQKKVQSSKLKYILYRM